MTEEKTQVVPEVATAEASAVAPVAAKPSFSRSSSARGGDKGRGGQRPPRKVFDRPKPEFDQKIISMRRVTRVMAGGRRFSFSVAMLLGDKRGRIGVGLGKSPDTALAIGKAVKDAKKNMISIGLNEHMSIAHEVSAKYASTTLTMFPNKGKGLVAGSAVRDMFNLAGIKDITAKITTRSKNKINIARAVLKAAEKLPGTKKVVLREVEEKKPEYKKVFAKRDFKKTS